MVLPAREEKTTDMFFANGPLEVGSLLGKKTKEKLQVSTVGGYGIMREPSLYRQILKEKLEMFAVVRQLQGRDPGAR